MTEDEVRDWFEKHVWPYKSSTADEFLDYIIQFMSEKHGIHLFEKHKNGKSYFTSNDDNFKLYMKDIYETEADKLKGNPWTLVLEESRPFLIYEIVAYNFYPIDFEQSRSGNDYRFEWKSINLFEENIWDFHYVGSPQRFIFERKEPNTKIKKRNNFRIYNSCSGIFGLCLHRFKSKS